MYRTWKVARAQGKIEIIDTPKQVFKIITEFQQFFQQKTKYLKYV